MAIRQCRSKVQRGAFDFPARKAGYFKGIREYDW
jgi:hypothetical protein